MNGDAASLCLLLFCVVLSNFQLFSTFIQGWMCPLSLNVILRQEYITLQCVAARHLFRKMEILPGERPNGSCNPFLLEKRIDRTSMSTVDPLVFYYGVTGHHSYDCQARRLLATGERPL